MKTTKYASRQILFYLCVKIVYFYLEIEKKKRLLHKVTLFINPHMQCSELDVRSSALFCTNSPELPTILSYNFFLYL